MAIEPSGEVRSGAGIIMNGRASESGAGIGENRGWVQINFVAEIWSTGGR